MRYHIDGRFIPEKPEECILQRLRTFHNCEGCVMRDFVEKQIEYKPDSLAHRDDLPDSTEIVDIDTCRFFLTMFKVKKQALDLSLIARKMKESWEFEKEMNKLYGN